MSPLRHARPTLAALLVAALVAGCDGDSAVRVGGSDEGVASGGGGAGADDGAGDGGAGGAGDGGADGDGVDAALPPGSRAGAYVGRLGEADGVLVLDRAGRLIGLTELADGSARSWLADFASGSESAAAERFAHEAGRDAARGAFSPLAEPAGEGPRLALVDGERIAGTSAAGGAPVALEASGRAALSPVTSASLAGRWRGEHVSCDSLGERCSSLAVTLDIDGRALSGASGVLTADGTDLFPAALEGTFEPLGHFAEVELVWNTYGYAGVMHFLPGESERIVLIGATDRELADHRVLAFVLERERR